MVSDPILQEYINANYLHSGLETFRLFKFKEEFFTNLKVELVKISTHYPKSNVADSAHGTHWTGMKGKVYQWSLLNTNGSTNDPTMGNHLKVLEDKKLWIKDVPNLRKFMSFFKDSMITCRLNYLGPNSYLEPHKEWIVHKDDRGVFARMRFHVPILTNTGVTAQLNNARIHMEAGYLYLFNNGTVHDARNDGDAGRYHLVFVCLVNQKLMDNMFYSRRENSFWEPTKHVIVNKELVEIPETYPSDGNNVNEVSAQLCKVL